MKLDRAYKIQRELEERIKWCYDATVYWHRTHDAHLEEMQRRVWHTPEYQKAPRHVCSYLQGVDHTLFLSLYSAALGFRSSTATPGKFAPLEWVLVGPDGRRFREGDDTWLKESPEYKLALGGNESKSTHAWRDALNAGEWKPFVKS